VNAMLSTEGRPVVRYSLAGPLAEQDCACGAEVIAPATLFSRPHVPTETDCACPETGSVPVAAESVNTPGPWQRAPRLYRAPLPQAHETIFNADAPVALAVLNPPARRVLDAFATPTTLAQASLCSPDLAPADVRRSVQDFIALNLIQPAGDRYRPSDSLSNSKPSTLTAWLHVTNACNLRCSYCYVHQTDGAMDEATGRAAVEAVFHSALAHDFQAVKLKYAGGEPTLNFSLVRTLHGYAQAQADSTGLSLSEVLLSNGVAITSAMLDFIHDAGMRLAVSLDGIGPAHDAQRAFADGRGSFALVEQSIERALAHHVRPYLSITVTAYNVHNLAEVVAFALDRELFFNLNFHRPCSSEATRSDLCLEDGSLIDGLRRAFAVIESRLPRYPLIGALLDRANFSAPHLRACGAGHSYLVIDPRGRVAHCQMKIDQPVTTIDAQDPLSAIQQMSYGFQSVSVDEKDDCHECPWRYWCAGGCPLLGYWATGRHTAPSPYCRVYRALYPEVVRLESLRLLRWH
jgi:uncharacterized protein